MEGRKSLGNIPGPKLSRFFNTDFRDDATFTLSEIFTQSVELVSSL